MKIPTSIKVYTDAGHAWAAVKRSLLVELGIAGNISICSYQRGQTVYLEEDCDLATFLAALDDQASTRPQFDTVDHGSRSPIRAYKGYRQ